jgi:hypothetical protein
MSRPALLTLLLLGGCGPVQSGARMGNGSGDDLQSAPPDLAGAPTGDMAGGQMGCGELQGCYTVYAHADHVLYRVDLTSKLLVEIGPFKAPMVATSTPGQMAEDVITDLAVSTSDVIYVISRSNLYTADPRDGHVTLAGAVTACGSDNVALTFTPDGSLYAADFKGAFCKVDITTKPPTVKQIGTLPNGWGISGDIVAVSDGTVYGTAYLIADGNNSGTGLDNFLVKIDPTNPAKTTMVGPIGFGRLFGVAFDNDKVFGFTHDGTGAVVTIDPKTGKGTLYNQFMDPTTKMGIKFAGAGVNANVMAPPPG